MAARKNSKQVESTREKIRETINTKLIVKKLQEHVTGLDEDGKKLDKETDLKGTQIRAAETLLARTMPTLSMSDITTTDTTESYEDLLQGFAEMADSTEDFKAACKLLNIQIIDNETNQELN